MKQVHLIIKGRVQGVFYRDSAKSKAFQLGICGWIRNNLDGTVESLVQGPEIKLRAFIVWCQKGPDNARVEDVQIKWTELSDNQESFNEFTIR